MTGINRKKHMEDINDFIQPVAKRRFISTNEPEFLDHTLQSADPNRLGAIFKGYFAGNPPPVLSRVDAR